MVNSISQFMTGRNKLFYFMFAVFFIVSCSLEDDIIGKWDDNIKLSVKSANFKAAGDSITINTEGDTWWINGIRFEDSTYIYNNREDINPLSDHYSIMENEFLVERRDKYTLFIKLNGNVSGSIRTMDIYLEAGNYFDRISIKQASE